VMEGGDTGGYSHGVLKSMTNDECHSSFHFVFVRGWLLSSVGASFPYMGGRFRTWVVVAWWWWWRSAVASLSISLPRRCQRRGTWLPCQQRKWGEGVFTHLLVVVAASDVAPQCRWRGGGVGRSSPLVGGVLLSCCCCGMVVVCCNRGCGESLLSSVMAADVAFLHRSDGVLACPGGCQWWAVVWRRWVGVVGGRCGWALWVGVVSGHREWASWVGIVGGGGWWWWWLRKKEVVVC